MAFSSTKMLILGGPGISILLGFGLFVTYRLNTQAVYLRLLSIAFVLFGLGVFVQVLPVPSDLGLNTMLSGVLYTGSVLSLGEGVLNRIQRTLGLWVPVMIATAIWSGLYYYFYVDRDLIARILILNLGCAVVLMIVVSRAVVLWKRTWLDKWLYAILVSFTLSFFLRVFLTLDGVESNTVARVFGESLFWIVLHLTLVLFGVLLAVMLMMVAVFDQVGALNRERTRDPLTGLLNRRGLDEVRQQISKRSTDELFAVVMLDLDHFKKVNDTYGHEGGDCVLKGVGEWLLAIFRPDEIPVRWGGEEILIYLKDKNLDQARTFAQRLCDQIAQLSFDGLPAGFHISASFGVAASQSNQSFLEVVSSADKKLYEAKMTGRNRVVY